MAKTLKRRIYELLDPVEGGTFWDKVVNTLIVALILLNAAATILETIEPLFIAHTLLFTIIEQVSVAIFTIEYLLRLWVCTEDRKYRDAVKGRIRYIFSFGALIDLFAFLPFYLPLLLRLDLRFLRLFRLLRFFRFFKLGRYMKASALIRRVFRSKKEELILSFVITFFLIIVASCIMYYTEHDAQPDKFSSIPETMWWSVATLTTVGYGDVYPVTIFGKTLTAFISILGIGLFALPAGILASGFSDEFRAMKKSGKPCPHCGLNMDV